MKIRHLTKADGTAAMKLSSLCFDYPYDTNGKTDEEYFEYLMNNPQETLHAHPECEIGAFTDDGELMAATAAIPFTFYFDGGTYSGNGIGNVSTYPQHRRKGAIRAIFMEILKESYESGQTFSYLYPFSEAFYSAFGYRRADNSIRHTYSLHVLPDYRFTGSFSIKQGNGVPQDYKTAYFVFAEKFNMMVKRGELDWKNLTEAKGSENNNYAYLYRDADGVPRGYLVFKKTERTMRCREFVFDSLTTLKALFSFARGFQADYDYIHFHAPACLNLACFCPDFVPHNSSRELANNGMVRVINMENALSGARYLTDGTVRIAVADPCLAGNNAVFTVSVKNGRASSVEKELLPQGADLTGIDCDIAMPVSVFSAAITGHYLVRDFDFMEEVSYDKSRLSMLEGIFYKKDSFINNYF